MSHHEQFQSRLLGPEPILALAPMQDVTTLAFWKLVSAFGGADLYVTEYFRVHSVSTPRKELLKCITENPTGRPVIAQVIGNDIPALVRTARELQQYPLVGVDLNLGCPAPVVYRKWAGSGLLRDPARVDAILGALRDAVKFKFTVKTRLGFAAADEWDRLLPVFAKHSLDLLTVHGRIAGQMNAGPVNYDRIAQAVQAMPCPVLANGDIDSAEKAQSVLHRTRAKGLMIGRGAIRNPWLFQQIRARLCGEPVLVPTGRDLLRYLRALYEAIPLPPTRERLAVQVMKKYTNYIGEAVEPTGRFLHEIRRALTQAEFFQISEYYLDHDNPMRLEPSLTYAYPSCPN